VKRNAIAGRSFPSWEALEAHLEAWTRDVADVRLHGTTGEAPIDRFQRAEAKALKPVAGVPPFHAARELIRRVQSDCAVEIDGNAYSVPWRLIGETVRATITDGVVRIYHGIHEVAVHPICSGRRRRVIDPGHFAGLTGIKPIPDIALASSPAIPALLRPLGEYEAITQDCQSLSVGFAFSDNSRDNGPNWRLWRRIPRCNLSFEEKVLAQTYWPTGQHPRPPDAPCCPVRSLVATNSPEP
jgi:hypothetical protein